MWTRAAVVRCTPHRQSTIRNRQTWKDARLNDPHRKQAVEAGWRSRASLKLLEIDDKYKLLKPGLQVIDLGCAPGGWSQVAAKRIGAKGRVIAIDRDDRMDPLDRVTFMQRDLTECTDEVIAKFSVSDVVMWYVPFAFRCTKCGWHSDAAPNSTGDPQGDHLRLMALCEAALEFSTQALRRGAARPGMDGLGLTASSAGGHLVVKASRGGEEHLLKKSFQEQFNKTLFFKPKSSRQVSREASPHIWHFR